eukprot:6254939-Lingulodinium_polyedra.AAC.1
MNAATEDTVTAAESQMIYGGISLLEAEMILPWVCMLGAGCLAHHPLSHVSAESMSSSIANVVGKTPCPAPEQSTSSIDLSMKN